MKKRLLRLTMLALSLGILGGCDSGSGDPRGVYTPDDTQAQTTPTESAAPTPDDMPQHPDSIDVDAPGVFSSEFVQNEIEGNGGYFVRAGRKVYYRAIRPEGMPQSALFAEFLNGENADASSVLAVYDLDTQGFSDVMDVRGSGRMYACVEGLLLADGNGSINCYDPVGRSSTTYCSGNSIVDVSDDGNFLAVTEYDTDYNLSYSVYEGKDKLYSVNGLLDVYGFAQDQLIAVRKIDDDAGRFEFVSYAADGTETSLGTFVKPAEIYDAWTIPELIEFEPHGDTVYLTVGYYEGTGHFLSAWEGYKMQAGKAQSLEDIEVTNANNKTSEGSEPDMLVDESGDVGFYDVKTNTVGLSEGYYGDLVYYDSPYGATVISKYMIYENMEPSWYDTMLESVVLDKTAFLIKATGHRLEEEDIGWRYAYYPESYAYYAIPMDDAGTDGECPRLCLVNEYPKYASKQDAVELKGTEWKCVSLEAEGQYMTADEDGFDRYLVFNNDDTVTYTVIDGTDTREYTLKPTELEYYEDYSCYEMEADDMNTEQWVLLVHIGDHLEFSVEWRYDDGTPGGCNFVFNPLDKLQG